MCYMPFLLTLESKMYAVRADILTESGEFEGIGWADNLKRLSWGQAQDIFLKLSSSGEENHITHL